MKYVVIGLSALFLPSVVLTVLAGAVSYQMVTSYWNTVLVFLNQL